MRFVTPVAALLVALVLTACGSVAAPKPDPSRDAAFVHALTQICAKTPPLVPIDGSASPAAIITAATENRTTVANLNSGLLQLTPTLPNSTPLAPTVTDLAQMLLDVIRRYTAITTAATAHDTKLLQAWLPLAVARRDQARGDLAKIGISRCLR